MSVRPSELHLTPATYRLVAEGHCGACKGELSPDPLLNEKGLPHTLRGATCAPCDLWWRSGSTSSDHQGLFVEVCVASAWAAGWPSDLRGWCFARVQVETYAG